MTAWTGCRGRTERLPRADSHSSEIPRQSRKALAPPVVCCRPKHRRPGDAVRSRKRTISQCVRGPIRRAGAVSRDCGNSSLPSPGFGTNAQTGTSGHAGSPAMQERHRLAVPRIDGSNTSGRNGGLPGQSGPINFAPGVDRLRSDAGPDGRVGPHRADSRPGRRPGTASPRARRELRRSASKSAHSVRYLSQSYDGGSMKATRCTGLVCVSPGGGARATRRSTTI